MVRVKRSLLLVDISAEISRLMSKLPEEAFALQTLTWGTVEWALQRAQPNSILVVEPIDPLSPSGTFERIQAVQNLLRRNPFLPVVAVATHPENNAEIYATLLQAGLTEWLDSGRESCALAVERRLMHAASVSVQRLIDRALATPLSSRTRVLLGRASEVASAGGKMPDLARALGVGKRTASRWLVRADLPPPRRLLAWIRVRLVADFLDSGRHSLEAIARATGYSSAASVKTALRNMLGTTPNDLRARGAFTTVAGRFSDDLRAIREARRVSGRPAKTWLN
jgi:AraC-like DNA-binding protein